MLGNWFFVSYFHFLLFDHQHHHHTTPYGSSVMERRKKRSEMKLCCERTCSKKDAPKNNDNLRAAHEFIAHTYKYSIFDLRCDDLYFANIIPHPLPSHPFACGRCWCCSAEADCIDSQIAQKPAVAFPPTTTRHRSHRCGEISDGENFTTINNRNDGKQAGKHTQTQTNTKSKQNCPPREALSPRDIWAR